MSKKKLIAVVITTLALTAGSIGVAGAASKGSHRAGVEKSVMKTDRVEKQALVSSIIGLETATILSRLKAGESLAQIAGDKKDVLIAALVADHTQRIDAAVTAGVLTAEQATKMKSKVVERVTAKVNAIGGKHGFGKGGHGRGHGGHGMKGGAKAPTLPIPAPGTGA
jgi:ribosomal protein S20